MVVNPSVIGTVDVPPTVIERPVAVSVPENESPPVGGGPSPMSSVAVPVRVIVPPTEVAPVIHASTLMIWHRPMRLIPVYSTWRSP
jgi:hypothetical protein